MKHPYTLKNWLSDWANSMGKEIDYTYIDQNGLTVTRLKPQKTVEEYRAHSGGLFDDDLIESIDDLTGENNAN